MEEKTERKNRSLLFAAIGFVMGVVAPMLWIFIRLAFFAPASDQGLWEKVVSDILRDGQSIALYCYMGFGTAFTLSTLGYLIGRSSDALLRRSSELDAIHRDVAAQKTIFEERFKLLDGNIKNFHQISSRLQKSLDVNEVLTLCSNGLHEVLEYEQVNILLADETRTHLRFFSTIGVEGYDTAGITLPLDSRIGIIHRCFSDKKPFLIEDITNYPLDYRVQPPYDTIKPLRSRSFMLCPIVVKGESIGVFGIDKKFSRRGLNETDLDTIKLFADQVGSAITRINLLRSIDTLARELEITFTELLRNRDSYAMNLENITSAVNSMTDSSLHIASSSESVMASVDETSSAVGEISIAIDQVSKNLDFLSAAVDKSVSAMEQINVTLKNVEQNTSLSHDVSSRVCTQAEIGKSVVEDTISAMDEIQKSVDSSYQGIKRLTENSGRIDNIVSVINAITKRTNLLALNASIIAAQAGEYGKSFGVVADEIRNLSLQTGQSTGEITGIIDEIRNESRLAADNVTATKDLVARGVEMGVETGNALQAILDNARKAMEMTELIKTATSEQTMSARLVTQSVEDVGSMTGQIFRASKEQASATRNIAAAIDSIKALSHDMADATGRQAADNAEIKRSLDSFGRMVATFFEDLSKRKKQSDEVMGEVEVIRDKSA